MKINQLIKYPDLDYSRQIYPNERFILGKFLVWVEKRDGSNIRCYLDENDDIQFGSRNMRRASLDLLQSINNTGYTDLLSECLKEEKEKWKSNLIIFFELLQHGKSPAHTEFHEKDDIAIFDVYSLENGWLAYNRIHQMCKMYDFPIVELWGTSIHSDIQSFKTFENDMLGLAKEKNREGVVGKYYHGFESLFFKNRVDLPDLRKVKKHFDDERILLPLLPIPEIRGAVHKVYNDLGNEKFLDKKIAMPTIAKYVGDECRKHLCSSPKNLYDYYLEKIDDMSNEN